MSTAIHVENLAKAYQLGQFSTGTLSNDISRWWTLMRGKEDPYLKIGETNDRTKKGESNIVWSLRNINFEIQEGEAVGIIGRNGAGKSTLLKLLSRVTSPTMGEIKIRGRVASLLEVGTGFHPELTGRENIFLNGAILGMRKKEIVRKFDEIVDFAEVERYIDTPVKRYSSGMYVRLAFAVAAYLESEILIVDEVLAVGDAEFQKKCLGKMGDVSKGEGRTILFVSHNMGAVNSLCPKAILLNNGEVDSIGDSSDIVSRYLRKNNPTNGQFSVDASNNDKLVIENVILKGKSGISKQNFDFSEDLTVEIHFNADKEIIKPNIAVCITSSLGPLSVASNILDGFNTSGLPIGKSIIRCTFKNIPLIPSGYNINIGVRGQNARDVLFKSRDVAEFTVNTVLSEVGMGMNSDFFTVNPVCPLIGYKWEFNDGSSKEFNILKYAVK